MGYGNRFTGYKFHAYTENCRGLETHMAFSLNNGTPGSVGVTLVKHIRRNPSTFKKANNMEHVGSIINAAPALIEMRNVGDGKCIQNVLSR